MDKSLDNNLQPPRKRFKMSESSKHIYDTFFKEQQFSDITIEMLNKSWKLHKGIIKQSSYFASMFSGSWKESEEGVIKIQIDDTNITPNSMEAVLGSLYSGEIELGVDNVVSVLATAALLQVQHVIDKCSELMSENISCKTATVYYNVAESYGVSCVKKSTIEWLETNLLWLSSSTDISFLKSISAEVMKEIIASPNFVTLGNEIRIYKMLKKWLAVNIGKANDETIDDFYKRQTWAAPFLTTEAGAKYKLPFQALRMEHLMAYSNAMTDNNFIKNENILPNEWINSCFEKLWQTEYLITSEKDLGPTMKHENQFDKECVRCGDFFEDGSPFDSIFRPHAHQFSMDFSFIRRASEDGFLSFSVKREQLNIFNNLKEHHDILIRISIVSIDENRCVTRATRTPILHFSLLPNETRNILVTECTLPLYMSFQWMVVTP